MALWDQILWHIMEFMSGSDVASLMLVNKAFYHLARISPIWHRTAIDKRNDDQYEDDDVDVAAVDWYARCRKRHVSSSTSQIQQRQAMSFLQQQGRWTKRHLPSQLLMGETTEEEVVTVVVDNGSYTIKAGTNLSTEFFFSWPSDTGP